MRGRGQQFVYLFRNTGIVEPLSVNTHTHTHKKKGYEDEVYFYQKFPVELLWLKAISLKKKKKWKHIISMMKNNKPTIRLAAQLVPYARKYLHHHPVVFVFTAMITENYQQGAWYKFIHIFFHFGEKYIRIITSDN